MGPRFGDGNGWMQPMQWTWANRRWLTLGRAPCGGATISTRRRRWTIRGALLLTLSVTASAGAAPWQVQPMLQARGEVDDNPRLSVDGGSTETALTGTAGVAARRMNEVYEVSAAASVGYTAYSGSDLPNDDAEMLQLDSAWRSDRSVWRLGAEWIRDTTVVDVSALQDELDPGTDIDRAVTEDSVRRRRLLWSGSFEHALSERLDGVVGYRGLRLDHSRQGAVTLRDSWTHRFDLHGRYRLSERDRVGVGVETLHFRASNADNDLDSVSLVVSLTRRLSELTTTSAVVGAWSAEASSSGVSGDDNGWLARFSLFSRGELWSLDLALERDLRPSAEGVLRQADQILLRLRYDLSPRLRLTLAGRGYELRAVDVGTTQPDRRYWVVEPRLDWQLAQDWIVGASYRYRSIDRGTGDGSADSHAVALVLEYRPMFEGARPR